MGTVGRESGKVRLRVRKHTDRKTLHVHAYTQDEARRYTDEWRAGINRTHATVSHGRGEWARDDDGDGIRENHTNTIEGIWTGFRNYLRRFRGVHKKYLDQYAAVFEWTFNLKNLQPEIVQAFCFSPCQRTIIGNST